MNRWSNSLPSPETSVGIEDGAEDLLHLADVLADADLRAGLQLDVGRAGQVVGVGMGLQHPLDREALGLWPSARIASADVV